MGWDQILFHCMGNSQIHYQFNIYSKLQKWKVKLLKQDIELEILKDGLTFHHLGIYLLPKFLHNRQLRLNLFLQHLQLFRWP